MNKNPNAIPVSKIFLEESTIPEWKQRRYALVLEDVQDWVLQ